MQPHGLRTRRTNEADSSRPDARSRLKCSYPGRALATAYVYGGRRLANFAVFFGFLGVFFLLACGSSWKGSVGAVLGKDNRTGRVFVREAPAGMGAARAGIEVDDEIVAIDGTPVTEMTPSQVHEKLAGDVGSKVTLRIKHANSAPRDVVVERGPLASSARPEPSAAPKPANEHQRGTEP